MNDIWFSLDINPAANNVADIFKRAQLADDLGYDLVTSQDHPYNRHHLDTWTMLTAVAIKTERVRIGTNVANLPLRPPAMLAKQTATLSILADREIALGVGAGAFWKGVKAYGGEERRPKVAYEAFAEALQILHGMWDNVDKGFTFEGDHYHIQGAIPGPAPAHKPRIWVGAMGPKMLNLTGRMADGLWISIPYVPPEKLTWFNERIDEGAAEAERQPDEIRRGYNLMGTLDPDRGTGEVSDKGIFGNSKYWADQLSRFHEQYRQDTFNFWPAGEAPYEQIERFAHEVIPAVQERFGQG